MSETVRFTLDGNEVEAFDGETIWQVAHRLGTDIPHLCYAHEPGYRADGNCRACMVEVEGERVLAASCQRRAAPGMAVRTATDRAKASRRMVMEMLVADQPAREVAHQHDSRLWQWAERMDVTESRLPCRPAVAPDPSHPAMRVNLDACIHCNLCVRACREVQVNDVIGMAYRGIGSKIVFDFDDAMGASTCVACGECVQACPTGALMEAALVDEAGVDRRLELDEVESVCPYCGVGCQITYQLKDGPEGKDKGNGTSKTIAAVQGRDGPANHKRLCVKGRFGFDYVTHPHRLTTPLIRRDDAPKSADCEVDPANPFTHFREATWEEALDRAAGGLAAIRDRDGGAALAGFGSAKGSNEEAYLVQKLVRQGFGTNNVDHCTRLCHASSVAALLEGIGSGAVTAPFTACDDSDVIIVIGANPTENHPVAATFFKQAAKKSTLIVMDPRGQALKRHATHMLQFNPGTDVALLNALLNVIVTEGLYDRQYIEAHVSGFDALSQHIRDFTPEEMAPICGIEADRIREVARTYAKAERGIIFWGMGISQHTHGTDNARCLIALSMITGHVGRPGTGLHPLRGQNNVQGASDAGLIPMVFPDYQSVEAEEIRARFEDLWGRALDAEKGLTVVEIMDAVHAGKISGMYIMGENPAMSDPDTAHARAGLAMLEHLVVQDLFLTETAFHADVVLPASAWPEKDGTVTNTNRQVQMGRTALAARRCPPGLVDHPGDRAAHRARLELRRSRRRVRGDEDGDALARQHHLGATVGRERRHLSLRGARQARHGHRVRGRFPDPGRTGEARPRLHRSPRRAARRRVPHGAHHRAPARALAHRRHHPPGQPPRHPGAGGHRKPLPVRPAKARNRGRRSGPGGDPPRHHRAQGPGRRRGAVGRGLHPVLLRGGGGEHAHESGPGPVREDPGVQVLRGAGGACAGAHADVNEIPRMSGAVPFVCWRHSLRD